MRADLLDLREDVARQEDRPALLADAPQQLADRAHLLRVETVRGLVEHEQLGPTEQRARDPEPLAHALRVRLDLAVDRVAEAGDGERAVDVGVGEAVAARLPVQLEVGDAGEVGHERRVLDHRADPPQLRAARPDRFAEQPRLAAVGMDEADEHPQRGRLARTVRTEQTADLAGADREVEMVDGEHGAVPLGEVADLDGRVDGIGAPYGPRCAPPVPTREEPVKELPSASPPSRCPARSDDAPTRLASAPLRLGCAATDAVRVGCRFPS